jgi:hypothetical protein
MVRPEALISIPEGLATRDDVGMASPLSLMLHQVNPQLYLFATNLDE